MNAHECDTYRNVAGAASLALILGTLTPVVAIVLSGSYNYWQLSPLLAAVSTGFGIAALGCTAQRRYTWLAAPGAFALALNSWVYLSLKRGVEDNASLNALSQAFLGQSAIQVDWGWLLLLLGPLTLLGIAGAVYLKSSTACDTQMDHRAKQGVPLFGVTITGPTIALFVTALALFVLGPYGLIELVLRLLLLAVLLAVGVGVVLLIKHKIRAAQRDLANNEGKANLSNQEPHGVG